MQGWPATRQSGTHSDGQLGPVQQTCWLGHLQVDVPSQIPVLVLHVVPDMHPEGLGRQSITHIPAQG